MKTEKPMVMGALRLEIIKPRDETWDETGYTMRALSECTPPLLNAAYDSIVAAKLSSVAAVCKTFGIAAKIKKRDGTVGERTLRSLPYAVVQARSTKLVKEIAKAKTFHPGREPVDASDAEKLSRKMELRRSIWANLEIPAHMLSEISELAGRAHHNKKKGTRVKFSSRVILVRGDNVSLLRQNGDILLEVKLRSRGTVVFIVEEPRYENGKIARQIVSGEIKHGSMRIKWQPGRADRGEKGKWFAFLSYSYPVPEALPVDKDKILAVHRGMRNAVTIASADGRPVFMKGNAMIAAKQRLHARKLDIAKRSKYERGIGSRGHGRKRRYEAESAIQDKIGRTMETFCQQTAAGVVKEALKRGCGTIAIEDYGGIQPSSSRHLRRKLDLVKLPLFKLKECIARKVQASGLSLIEVPARYVSIKCPKCLIVDERSLDTKENFFACRNTDLNGKVCGFKRTADEVAVTWMLRTVGADLTEWESLVRTESLRRLVRSKAN